MREIKFRAWDTDKKIMIEPNDYDFICYSGHLGEAYPHEGDGQPMMSDVFNRIIMQFTGLYDSGNKPIYEGDILYSEFEEEYFEVYYEEEFGGYGIKGNRGFDKRGEYWDFTFLSVFLDQDDRSVTVEGNIYENSELVDKLSDKEGEEEKV